MLRRIAGLLAGAILASALLAGCGDMNLENPFRKRETPPEPQPETTQRGDSVTRGIVAEKIYLGDAGPMRLRGFGVVIGLGENGSNDAPAAVRDYLIEYLNREMAAEQSSARGPRPPNPEQLLDQPDSAIVLVDAQVPAGVRRGDRFDVHVEALGPGTRSLQGGVLLPAELKVFSTSSTAQGIISSRTLARASGPVFVNPFSESGSADRRRGLVLSGGRSLGDRPLRLLLTQPSSSMARQIERRINERFGHTPPVAEAISQGLVLVKTPPAYADEPAHFIELVTHVYLENAAAAIERKLRALNESLGGDTARLARISLIWEAIGKPAIPALQALYSHERAAVRFYAARAGLALKDSSAIPILAKIAGDASDPQQLQAVRALGDAPLGGVAENLAPLLDSTDQQVCVAAYEALRKHQSSAIRTLEFPDPLDPKLPSLTLDLVTRNHHPLIYVRRTHAPRVAVFGKNVGIIPPVFYSHPDGAVTVNAEENAKEVTLWRRTPSGKTSDKLRVPPVAAALIAALADLPLSERGRGYRGLGMHYSYVVQVLDALCRDGSVPARLVLEQTPVEELLGPPTERPESEEAPEATSEPATSDDERAGDLQPSAPAGEINEA